MKQKIEEFSSGYYATELKAVPYEDGPTIEEELYEVIDKKLYWNTDVPIWMRQMDGPYFRTDREFSIPQDRIGLPEEWMIDFGIETDDYVMFLIAKPQHALYITNSMYFDLSDEQMRGEEI